MSPVNCQLSIVYFQLFIDISAIANIHNQLSIFVVDYQLSNVNI